MKSLFHSPQLKCLAFLLLIVLSTASEVGLRMHSVNIEKMMRKKKLGSKTKVKMLGFRVYFSLQAAWSECLSKALVSADNVDLPAASAKKADKDAAVKNGKDCATLLTSKKYGFNYEIDDATGDFVSKPLMPSGACPLVALKAGKTLDKITVGCMAKNAAKEIAKYLVKKVIEGAFSFMLPMVGIVLFAYKILKHVKGSLTSINKDQFRASLAFQIANVPALGSLSVEAQIDFESSLLAKLKEKWAKIWRTDQLKTTGDPPEKDEGNALADVPVKVVQENSNVNNVEMNSLETIAVKDVVVIQQENSNVGQFQLRI